MEKILISSDSSLCVEFGSSISEEINQRVNAFAKLLEKENVPGVTELVPTYRSVTVHYRPEQISYARLRTVLEELSHRNVAVVQELQPEIVIPVLYGGTCGPDLPRVAALHGLTEEEVVRLHTAPSYLIYMMGFLPGFCYLGLGQTDRNVSAGSAAGEDPRWFRRYCRGADWYLSLGFPWRVAVDRQNAAETLRPPKTGAHPTSCWDETAV